MLKTQKLLKMKYLQFGTFILLLNILACSTPKEEENENTEVSKEEEVNKEQEETTSFSNSSEDIFGYYVGTFTPTELNKDANDDAYPSNKITISIDSLNEEKNIIYGHSIVAGNKRPFEGKYEVEGSEYVTKVKEPGDNPYDGAFEFRIKPEESLVKGTWEAYKKDFSVTATKYSLEKKEFKYDKDLKLPEGIQWATLYNNDNESMSRTRERLTKDVEKLNASNTLLKKEDIENMYKGDLEVIRNSIYARHGYSFKNRKMRFVFDHIDWYVPVSVDIRSKLTDLEKKNIDLLKRYEQHSTQYYDTFGR